MCNFVSSRSGTQCQLKAGHGGDHRAWGANGIPTLKASNAGVV